MPVVFTAIPTTALAAPPFNCPLAGVIDNQFADVVTVARQSIVLAQLELALTPSIWFAGLL